MLFNTAQHSHRVPHSEDYGLITNNSTSADRRSQGICITSELETVGQVDILGTRDNQMPNLRAPLHPRKWQRAQQ